MTTPEMFVVHRGKPYVFQKNGNEVCRIDEKGTLSRLTQEEEITRVLFHHTVLTESEALILAYAKPAHMSAKPAPRSLVKLKERFSTPHKIVALAALMVLVLPFIPINWGILIQFLIVVLAIPAVAFLIVFVIVVLVSLYIMIDWVILTLIRK